MRPSVTGTYAFFSGLGEAPVAVLTVAFAAGILWRNTGVREAAYVAVAAGGAVGLCQLFASLTGPTRMWAAVYGPDGPNGYPSGHVGYAAGAFGAIALVARRHGRPEVVAVCAALVAGMCVSRVADASHFAGDVVGALLLAAGWLLVLGAVAPRDESA